MLSKKYRRLYRERIETGTDDWVDRAAAVLAAFAVVQIHDRGAAIFIRDFDLGPAPREPQLRALFSE